jgi:hypothetical protein
MLFKNINKCYLFILIFIQYPSVFAQEIPDQTPVAFLTKDQSQTLVLELKDRKPWQERALTWFSSTKIEDQRTEMRVLSKSIQYGCFDCHTKGFKGYLPNQLISQQMMAIAVENDVKCEYCHIGSLGLNQIGVKSQKMWKWSIELGKDCLFCHEEKQRFKKLNAEGEKYKGDWEKRELKSPK